MRRLAHLLRFKARHDGPSPVGAPNHQTVRVPIVAEMPADPGRSPDLKRYVPIRHHGQRRP